MKNYGIQVMLVLALGATGVLAQQSRENSRSSTSSSSMSSDQLKRQLDDSLQKEPALSSCNIKTDVTSDRIELTGTCPTAKEKQSARRLVQSLAGPRRVVDRIEVNGQDKPEQENQTPPR